MKVSIVTLENQVVGDCDLNDSIFGLPERRDILARMVRYQLSKRRAGTSKVKGRSEVHFTTKKMFRQKGTGNARHGNAAAPQFRSGGRAFGPHPRDHSISLPKKIRALALKTALSLKAARGDLVVVDDFEKMSSSKTRDLQKSLNQLTLKSALFIDGSSVSEKLSLAARNIPLVDVLPVQGINVYDILRRNKLVLSKKAIESLEARFK